MKTKKRHHTLCICGGRLQTPAEHQTRSARYKDDISARQICSKCGLLPLRKTDFLSVSRTKAKKILASCCHIDGVHDFPINKVSKDITGPVYKAIRKLMDEGFRDSTIADSLLNNFSKGKIAEILKEELH